MAPSSSVSPCAPARITKQRCLGGPQKIHQPHFTNGGTETRTGSSGRAGDPGHASFGVLPATGLRSGKVWGAVRRGAGGSRARSLPHGFGSTKPVGPARPREGGRGRESRHAGRGRPRHRQGDTGHRRPPCSQQLGEALLGSGELPKRGFGAGGFVSAPVCNSVPPGAVLSPILTVHLALIREDDFPPAAGGVNRQRLLEALLDVRTPHPLGIIVQTLVHAVLAIFPPLPGAAAGVPAVGRYGAGCSGLRPRAPTDTRQPVGTEGHPLDPATPAPGCRRCG